MSGARHYALIIVGAGFAYAFFLMRYLERAQPSARVLVLERGRVDEASRFPPASRASICESQSSGGSRLSLL
jgi:hypothetical protein